jgi:hypothetical protein
VQLSLLAIYVGPDQMMPIASILATVMGFLMIFWNKLIGVLRRIFGRSKPAGESTASTMAKDEQTPK